MLVALRVYMSISILIDACCQQHRRCLPQSDQKGSLTNSLAAAAFGRPKKSLQVSTWRRTTQTETLSSFGTDANEFRVPAPSDDEFRDELGPIVTCCDAAPNPELSSDLQGEAASHPFLYPFDDHETFLYRQRPGDFLGC